MNIKSYVYYAIEKQKKLTIFYSACTLYAGGLVYVGFRPAALGAYQTFCTAVGALAIGFFAAHAAQKHSEVKYQATNGSTTVEVEENQNGDTPSDSK